MSDSDPRTAFDKNSYTLTRELDAPVADVWRFWTEPHHLKHWFGPKDFEILDVSVDLRTEGEWKTRMRSSDGSVHTTHGVFAEIVEQDRLVMTQTWEGSDVQSEIAVSLAEKNGGTEIVFKHRRLESDESRDSHAEGWGEALDNLDRYLAS